MIMLIILMRMSVMVMVIETNRLKTMLRLDKERIMKSIFRRRH